MPRTLAAALRPYVSSRARTRGEGYARQGRISIVHSSPTSVSARVRGSMLYEVSLDIEGASLQAWCACPFFAGAGEPCKHVWAVALVADRQHLLAVPADLELEGRHLDLYDLELPPVGSATFAAGRAQRPARAATPPPWEAFLAALTPPPGAIAPITGAPTAELLYVFDSVRSSTGPGMVVELLRRQRRRNGQWASPRDVFISRGDLQALPDPDDREILERVCGASDAWTGTWNIGASVPVPSPFVLTPALQRDVVERMCATGRLMLRTGASGDGPPELVPISWSRERATFRLSIDGAAEAGYTVTGIIDHQGEARPLHDALFVTPALVLWRPVGDARPTVAPFDAAGAGRWLAGLLTAGSVHVPSSASAQLLTALATADLPHVTRPGDLQIETRVVRPQPIARVITRRTRIGAWPADLLAIEVSFAYGPREVASHAPAPVLFDVETRVAWRRDPAAEASALARLIDLGARPLARADDVGYRSAASGTHFDVVASNLPAVVRGLIADGWRVEAEGRAYRTSTTSALGVRSGIDWFELHGALDFDGLSAPLPAVLAAARRGESFVSLDDGSLGLLPDEWLARSLRMVALGEPQGDHVRFGRAQAALIDAWLAEQPVVTWDEPFARLRDELAHFTGVAPEAPPTSFQGALRGYQQDALGWFSFLRQFGFGGCLADEMGLGKTVMVLAALEVRRLEHERSGSAPQPSLIVVPRSLVFNWQQEAARFAPRLRLLDITGSQRRQGFAHIGSHDVAIATYGTLRRDVEHLKDVTFDYVILDEAQAIKNAGTAAARAARLLRGRHRLALSGTPVENHLGELWSLFEFLNPGLLGSATAFTGARAITDAREDDGMLQLIERGLRPFILRRTKEQVASELPARTEQTLYCDLGQAQRKLYDSLRAHYRASLLGGGARDERGRSTIHVLEALLRLRQAACHPGLIDPEQAASPSAKLDMLLPRLQELVDDGRKVLVFSQFTSLLTLLRGRLDASELAYEYLDGRTRDREARVRQFQEGPCPLFLISLKAGGLGLNLTAADYVFLLDPWWNPAVEAQAIDRAHRIGQTRAVFAYRLIARDTVEEKVLALQERKRHLADAVVRADASLLRDLKREDLDLLLS